MCTNAKWVRWFLTASLAAFQALAFAQAPSPQSERLLGHDWTRVQAIFPGTLIHVKTTSRSTVCRIAGVDVERLRCEGGQSYARADVLRVALSRRGASAAGMAALGAGVGVATTAIVSKAGGLDGSAKGSVWAGAAGLGAVILAPVGFFGDPFRGPVVYRAR